MLKEHNDLFLIASGGGGFTKQEYKYFEFKRLEKRILFRGAVDDTLATLYSNALAFIFPSLYEGFGIPALEAMKCDCPVIMSNTSSLPEVGGDAAIYFDPTDLEDIRTKITNVIFNMELRNELIAKGIIQRNKFSFTITAKQTLDVYKRIINSRI